MFNLEKKSKVLWGVRKSAVEMTNCRQEPAVWSIEGHLLSRSGLRWPDLAGAGQGPSKLCGSVGVLSNISQLVFPPAEALSSKRVPGMPEGLFDLQ